ncbi:glycerophosphodiester phosphodiesterase family protein [Chloroflexota bacterium]
MTPYSPPSPRPIEIVCHRGANQYAPENTYASVQLCLDWAMDYLEIDVNTSKDGLMHVFHGPQLKKTTNGTGMIFDRTAAELDRLDAGSWFAPQFAGERIPRLEPFLRWLKGKIKVFFDVKLADLNQLVKLVHDMGLEEDCFFWFELDSAAREFRRLAPHLALKMNAATVEQVAEAHQKYHANIIEVELDHLSQDFMVTSRQRGMKVMVNYGGKEPDVFQQILRWQPDMLNTNHGDIFAKIQSDFVATGE